MKPFQPTSSNAGWYDVAGKPIGGSSMKTVIGIFIVSVCVGHTKRKVWLRTITSPRVSAIFGMWQAMHSLPALPAA